MYRLVLREPCRSVFQRTLQQQHRRQYSSSNGLPPNVRQAGFGKVLLLLSPAIVVGGAITYANYDPEFRKTLEKNVPGAARIIKIGLQEENPFEGINKQYKNLTEQFDSVSKTISDATSTVTSFFVGSSVKEQPKKEDDVPSKPQKISQTQSPTQTQKTAVPASKPAAPAPSAAAPAAVAAPPPPAKGKSLDALPKEIQELERSIEVAAALAVKEYNKAIGVLKAFNEDVRKVVDHAVEHMDPSSWTTLKNKTNARDTSLETAETLARDALNQIEKCEIALSKATTANNHDEVLALRGKIKTLIEHINHVKDELYHNKDLSILSETYWRNVEKARNYFIDEIESIFPGLNLSEKKLNIEKEDLDLLITHAYSHVLALQKELQRLQTDGELRLKRAIDAFRAENDTEAAKAQLDYHLEVERRKIAIDNQKKIFQIRTDAEKQLRQQLKQQAEAHIDHLNDAIMLKETEIKRSYGRELEDKLSAERANYKLQLAAMLGKMRGMDAALQARAESERSAHQAQALWAACQALWANVRTGEPGVHWREQLRPLKNEIQAIATVAEGDELVAVVLNNLPPEAKDRGVFPEDALRERFLKVERLGRRLALIPEGGSNLPMYFLSFLQSVFIMRPDDPISVAELQNQRFDYSKLDTYDILNRARYFVDRGDLMQALKYMNLLQGAPRKIATDWLKETRLMLETQQAANTLMAHAAASGLLYL